MLLVGENVMWLQDSMSDHQRAAGCLARPENAIYRARAAHHSDGDLRTRRHAGSEERRYRHL